jgi:hypothetical protein
LISRLIKRSRADAGSNQAPLDFGFGGALRASLLIASQNKRASHYQKMVQKNCLQLSDPAHGSTPPFFVVQIRAMATL